MHSGGELPVRTAPKDSRHPDKLTLQQHSMMLSSSTSMPGRDSPDQTYDNYRELPSGLRAEENLLAVQHQFYTSGMSGKLLSTIDRGAITIKDGDTFLSNPGAEIVEDAYR